MMADSRLNGVRRLPLVQTGAPVPFRTVMPAYLAALAGWLAASVVLVIATPALVDGAIATTDVVLAAPSCRGCETQPPLACETLGDFWI